MSLLQNCKNEDEVKRTIETYKNFDLTNELVHLQKETDSDLKNLKINHLFNLLINKKNENYTRKSEYPWAVSFEYTNSDPDGKRLNCR